jgi:hypothetical protein
METPMAGSIPTNWWTDPSLVSSLAVSFHIFQDVWRPKRVPQSGGWKCHSMPFGTTIPIGTLFEQPEKLSKPPDYQSEFWCISLI